MVEGLWGLGFRAPCQAESHAQEYLALRRRSYRRLDSRLREENPTSLSSFKMAKSRSQGRPGKKCSYKSCCFKCD